jgi:butyrate kinase
LLPNWSDIQKLVQQGGRVRDSLKEMGDRLTEELLQLQEGVRPGAEDPVLGALLGSDLSEVVRKVGWNSLIVNPGSTTTKLSVYNGLKLAAYEEVRTGPDAPDSVEERVEHIVRWFEGRGLRLADLTGIAARGGFLSPVKSGTYRVTPRMLEDLKRAPFSHASNFSVPMALALQKKTGQDVLLTVTDPVTVDEVDAVYRITGSSRMRNEGSAVHALNHRATARLASQCIKKDPLHIITCHIGGGTSAARHLNGRMVQVAQGFGTMPSANRSGSLPLHQAIRMLKQHEMTLEELEAEVMSAGGLLALAGTSDFKKLFQVEKEISDESKREKIRLVREFFANRIAGCIQELAASEQPVELIVLSGGLANDMAFCRQVADRIHLACPVGRLPGSVEQQALAAGLLRACAEPNSKRDYFECRDRVSSLRKQEDRLLDTPIFEPPAIPAAGGIRPTRLDEIIAMAASSENPLTVALVGADNEEALLAAKLANESQAGRLARFLLVGSYSRISELSWELDVPIDDENYFIVDAADPVAKSMELLMAGVADTLMKGSVMTAALLKGYLGYLKAKGLTGRGLRLSHLGLFEIPGRTSLVCITDAAINTYPDVQARIEILENALDALHLLGFKKPRVAVVSAVEKPSNAVISSMDGQTIAQHFKDRPDLIIEGPLSIDLALSPHSAREKRYAGKIQGDADLLLVPDIDAGNAVYKAFTVTSGAEIAGAVIGGEIPFILTSRGDSSRSKLASIALVLALTQKKKSGRTS